MPRCGEAIPAYGFFSVLRHAAAVFVRRAEIELRNRITLRHAEAELRYRPPCAARDHSIRSLVA